MRQHKTGIDKMKEEMKTLYIYARTDHAGVRVEASTNKLQSTQCLESINLVSTPISEMMVTMPILSEDELLAILSGTMLETLIAEKEKLQAETHKRLMAIDEKIGQLQALELKP